MKSPFISMRGIALFSLLWICLGLGLVGCSKEESRADLADSEPAMASVDPTIKTTWDKAMTAAKANEYAGAIMLLKTIVDDPKLTPEQKAAVENAMKAVSDQMYDALNRGDAKAQQAIEELRRASGR